MSVDSDSGTHWISGFARHGDREALSFATTAEGGTVSIGYAALGSAARSAIRRLRAIGVEGGDIVAVLAPPSLSGVALIHAMLDRGIVLLPLNERLSKEEFDRALRETRARFLLVSKDRDETLGRQLAETSGCGLLLLHSEDAAAAAYLADPSDADFAPEIELDRSPDSASDELHASSRRRRLAEGAAIVLQTSGTSGRPKGAVLTFDNLIASAEGSARLLGAAPDDRWLLCMPLFHIGGLSILIRSAASGASVVLHRRFDPVAVAHALDCDRITRVSFVATMLSSVLAIRGSKPAPPKLALVLLGGGPASQSLLSSARSLGYPIAPTYGLTEAASQVATRPPDIRSTPETGTDGDAGGDAEDAPKDACDLAAGLRPLPNVEIRVVDEVGVPVEAGVEGEIQVRGPIVMCAYLDDPEATSRAIRDGWLSTGDIGRLDPSGHLRVLDRRTDLIVSGGENIYPAEIESRLAEHPDVEEACVVGIDDERFGARPIAFVVRRIGGPFDPVELASFCREKLAGYKVPIDFIERERLPRTASGKLLRRILAVKPGARPG